MKPEGISSLYLLLLGLVGVSSLAPVKLRRGWRVWALYYPIVGVVLWRLYETAMLAELPPESVPIQLDLAFIYLLMGFILLTGAGRWWLWLSNAEPEKQGAKKSEMGAQLLLVIVSLVVCFGWFISMWL